MAPWQRFSYLLLFSQLLDNQLSQALDTASLDIFREGNPVLEAILALLTKDYLGG